MSDETCAEDNAFLDRQAEKLGAMNGGTLAADEQLRGLLMPEICERLMKRCEELAAKNAALRSLLRDVCWWSGARKEFDRQGYSLDVREETAFRDVNYRRGYPLYATADEAIDAALADMKEESK